MPLALLQDLVNHKSHSDAAYLTAIRTHPLAAADPELLKTLHHILLANRFWLSLFLNRAFDLAAESKAAADIDTLAAQYRATQAEELGWISGVTESELQRRVETPFIPGRDFSVAEGLMQVCMHSHAHRAQCAIRLRSLGTVPPATDFVMWLKDRAAPVWD
jgi:uncharacterized damage-inducible protein DinB